MEKDEEQELGELEKQFKAVYDEHIQEINVHLEKASEELQKAVKISEKYGIPFGTNISFLGQNYTPRSLEKKWKDLDQDIIQEVSDYEISFNEYDGWQHSAVC